MDVLKLYSSHLDSRHNEASVRRYSRLETYEEVCVSVVILLFLSLMFSTVIYK